MIAPGVTKLNFFSAGSESFLRKNVEKRKGKEEIPNNAISIVTTIKATKFGMTLFNGTYL